MSTRGLTKLKRQKRELEYRLEQLVQPDLLDRDVDWFEEWGYLQSQIDRVTRLIEQEESWQASSH